MLGQYGAYPMATPQGVQAQPMQMQQGYAPVPGQLFYILITFATLHRSIVFTAVFCFFLL